MNTVMSDLHQVAQSEYVNNHQSQIFEKNSPASPKSEQLHSRIHLSTHREQIVPSQRPDPHPDTCYRTLLPNLFVKYITIKEKLA